MARKPPQPRRDPEATRARLLRVAGAQFSRLPYEGVGVRDIAREAGVDAALVSRYFGSKEGLFAEVLRGAFEVDALLDGDLDTLGERIARFILTGSLPGGAHAESEAHQAGLHPLHLLLRSAGSPAAAARVSAQFHAEFVQPLARRIGGRDAAAKAALVASYTIGLATMSAALQAPATLQRTGALQRRFAAAVAATLR